MLNREHIFKNQEILVQLQLSSFVNESKLYGGLELHDSSLPSINQGATNVTSLMSHGQVSFWLFVKMAVFLDLLCAYIGSLAGVRLIIQRTLLLINSGFLMLSPHRSRVAAAEFDTHPYLNVAKDCQINTINILVFNIEMTLHTHGIL